MKNNFNPLAQRISDQALQRDRLFSIQLEQGDSYLGGRMKKPDFHDYLVMKHADQYVGLDDDMPEDFSDWLTCLDSEEYIGFANAYACEYGKIIIEECRKVVINGLQ